MLDVEVVLYGVICDIHIVGRDKVLQRVVVRVGYGHLSGVYVLNAHLSGIYIDLPRVDLGATVVVEDVGYARGWHGRRRYLMEVLH